MVGIQIIPNVVEGFFGVLNDVDGLLLLGLLLKALAVFAIIIGGLLLFPLDPRKLLVFALALEPKRVLLAFPLDPKALVVLLLEISLLLLLAFDPKEVPVFPPAPKLLPVFAVELFPVKPDPLFAVEPAPGFLLIGATLMIYRIKKKMLNQVTSFVVNKGIISFKKKHVYNVVKQQ